MQGRLVKIQAGSPRQEWRRCSCRPWRAPAGAVLHATARHTLKMMRPAPVIRIRGRATPGGARITLLYPGARNPRRCPSV